MPGGAFDDPDMRYGFAIDKLFSKRLRRAKECRTCGGKVGVGQLTRSYCNDCRSAAANDRIKARRDGD